MLPACTNEFLNSALLTMAALIVHSAVASTAEDVDAWTLEGSTACTMICDFAVLIRHEFHDGAAEHEHR